MPGFDAAPASAMAGRVNRTPARLMHGELNFWRYAAENVHKGKQRSFSFDGMLIDVQAYRFFLSSHPGRPDPRWGTPASAP